MAVSALIIAAIAAGVLGVASSAAAGVANYKSTEAANEANKEINVTNNAFNAEQAAIQRQWEENMSNTSIQRKMADLKAAGLNPMLAVNGGGASTPAAYAATSAGNAQMRAADFSPLAQMSANLGHLVNSAARIEQIKQFAARDPKGMSSLAAISRRIVNSTNSSAEMARRAVLVGENPWLYD